MTSPVLQVGVWNRPNDTIHPYFDRSYSETAISSDEIERVVLCIGFSTTYNLKLPSQSGVESLKSQVSFVVQLNFRNNSSCAKKAVNLCVSPQGARMRDGIVVIWAK